MVGSLSISDVVMYENKLYKVVSCQAMNWFMEYEPMVYGLITYGKKEREDKGVELYVREGLLRKATPYEIRTWRLFYANETDGGDFN